ncbi:MAG: HAD family hydrolase [Coriobacteriia bacterium]|nr:HAD family hydrolase [Coriobacteriia bacterium]
MIKGVLFDLDGTLLDIDIEAFLDDYFAALGPVIASLLPADADPASGLRAVLAGTSATVEPHPGLTNREVFNRRFAELTGIDLDREEYSRVLHDFYRDTFPGLQGELGPRDGAQAVVSRALELGMRVAVATNPIFPEAAIRERMRWAGLDDLDVHLVTTYETMQSTKPLPSYFIQTAEMLGVAPQECLMVGDDRSLDMSASDVGMTTFYVGRRPIPACDYDGDLRELAELLPRLA